MTATDATPDRTVDTDLAEGDVLHLWLRPAGEAAGARVRVDVAGEHRLVGVEGPTMGFLPARWTAVAGGPARLAWSEADTAVSVIYAYTPGRVGEDGLRLLFTGGANAIDGTRYRLHAHPPFGWMNDPNGLCEVGGVTHLFYQHNPHARRWSTMHWGHAVSRDGLAWVHQPVAVLPREEMVRLAEAGGAYSGTVLPLRDGTLRVFHTDRQESRRPSEHQMTALLHDGIAAPSLAVLDTPPDLPGYRNDWRDPFLFTGPDGGLKMLVGGADAGGSVVLLYETDEPDGASGWRYVDVLHREPGRRIIAAECPCMVPLAGEGEGLWVLIFGLIGSRDAATQRRNLTLTYIGRFDGRRFTPVSTHELDFGTDCYAMQVWQGADGPRGIAWAANWTDVFADRDFESAMTFPRRLLWRNGRLETPPIAAVETLRERALGDLRALPGGRLACPDGLAEVVLTLAPGATVTLTFEHPTHEIALTYDGATLELLYEPPGHRTTPRYVAPCPDLRTLRVIVDVGLIEVFADDGRLCCTKRIDSPAPVEALRLDADEGAVTQAAAWALRPPATAG